VINKVRNAADQEVVKAFCSANNLQVIAEIPNDLTLADAERAGRPPLDFDSNSPAVAAIRQLAGQLAASPPG